MSSWALWTLIGFTVWYGVGILHRAVTAKPQSPYTKPSRPPLPAEGRAPWERLRDAWALDHFAIPNGPTTPAIVDGLALKYNATLPDDFRDYLLNALPLNDEMDLEGYGWWGLNGIQSLSDGYEHPISNPEIAARRGQFLLFADYLMWCWAWAICCSDDEMNGKVALIGGSERIIADSFAEFVDMYLTDLDKLDP